MGNVLTLSVEHTYFEICHTFFAFSHIWLDFEIEVSWLHQTWKIPLNLWR